MKWSIALSQHQKHLSPKWNARNSIDPLRYGITYSQRHRAIFACVNEVYINSGILKIGIVKTDNQSVKTE